MGKQIDIPLEMFLLEKKMMSNERVIPHPLIALCVKDFVSGEWGIESSGGASVFRRPRVALHVEDCHALKGQQKWGVPSFYETGGTALQAFRALMELHVRQAPSPSSGSSISQTFVLGVNFPSKTFLNLISLSVVKCNPRKVCEARPI